MVVSVISFSENGWGISLKLKQIGREQREKNVIAEQSSYFRLFTKWSGAGNHSEVIPVSELTEWVQEQFEAHHGLLFIGACGIAVRSIAPFVQNKLTDSPVLVMDEKGEYVIPILSGHVGGGNRIAREIAQLLGAQAVLTTATDVNEKFAVDVFAAEQGFSIQNKDGIAKISGKLLRGERVTFAAEGLREEQCELLKQAGLQAVADRTQKAGEVGHADLVIAWENPGKDVTLWLKPKPYVLGMGCKKGKPFAELWAFVKKELEKLGVSEQELRALSSVDRKQEEDGLLDLADYLHIPFFTYGERELAAVQGDFAASAFVEKVVGVDNVCERAAWLGAGEKGEFILKKTAENGMTLAVVRREV